MKFKNIIGIVLISLFLLTGCLGSNSNNGYTAGVGDTLKINEKLYHFNIQALSSIEKYTIANSILFDGDHARLKISVENENKDEVNLSIVDFALTDANKTDIAKAEIFFTNDESIFANSIPAKSSQEGYIYFDHKVTKEDIDNKTPFDDSIIQRAEYLKVSVIASASKNGDRLTGKYEDYYLKLK